MRTGRMDQAITIERRTEVSDGTGGVSRSWTPLAEVWAAVKPRVGRESMSEGRIAAAYSVTFTIYNRDIEERDRIVWNGEYYNVRGVMRAGERELYLDVDAERGASE